MTEKYQPSDEEMQRAEATMLPDQAKLSKKREQAYQKLQKLGVTGWLTYEQYGDGTDDDPLTSKMEGELNGHQVLLVSGGRYNSKREIDGLEMSYRASSAVWEKYGGIARLQPKAEIEAARVQVHVLPQYNPEHEQAEALLKDIL